MAGAALCPTSVAHADDWPVKPIRLIVPMNAGGAADIWARIIVGPLSEALGQQLYVENHGGAGGLLGSKLVADAEPDGSTLLLSGMSSQVVSPVTNKAATNPMSGFTHIAYLGGPPLVLIVHPSLGVKDFKSFIALLHSEKQLLGYASPGFGTFSNLFAELLFKTEQVKLDHVSYKGASAAMVDVIGGHVKIGCLTWTTAAASIKAGSVIALAVRRRSVLPTPPMFRRSRSWAIPTSSRPPGLRCPVPPRCRRRSSIASTGISSRRWQRRRSASRWNRMVLTQPMTPQQFTNFVQHEIDQWGPVAQQVSKANR